MPRSVAFAGAMWRVGQPTCLIPVQDPTDDDKGSWVEVPVVACSECHQLAPASPCADCVVDDDDYYPSRSCDVCSRNFKAPPHHRTCSNRCATLKANSHNSATHYKTIA